MKTVLKRLFIAVLACLLVAGVLPLHASADGSFAYEVHSGGIAVYTYYSGAVSSVQFPTWTNYNGQDDLIWYNGSAGSWNVNGSYYNYAVWFPISDHNNEGGTYITHVYVNGANVASGSYEVNTSPTVVRATTVQNGTAGYYVYAFVSDNGTSGISRVQFPTWTDYNGQDDIQSEWWSNSAASGTFGSWTIDGQYYNCQYYVSFAAHNGETGYYITHIYAYNALGNQGTGGVDITPNFNTPYIAKAIAVQNGTGGFWIYARAETNGGYDIGRVQYPTWTNANGQDDLAGDWQNNSSITGTSGSWTIDGYTYNTRFYVDVAAHNNEYGTYITDIYPYNKAGLTAGGYRLVYTASFGVSVNPNGGAWGGNSAAQTLSGEVGAVKDIADPTPPTGYHFTGWTKGGVGTWNASSKQFTIGVGDGSLTANYVINNYAVSFNKNGTGYTNTTPASNVDHGGSVSFTVTLSDGYTNSANPSVTATNGSVSATKSGNTITYTVSNITGATTISVGAATLNTYAVSFSADGTGYTNTTPASTVNHGGSVSFDVTLSEGYTNSAEPSVTATNGTVSASKNGNTITYTVSNITGATAISVGAATINTYGVTFSADGTGYTSTSPAATVNHGGSVSFTVTLSDGYTNSGNPSVTATNGTVSASKEGNTITYTVSNITGATAINVGAATLNTYTVKFINSLTGEQIGSDQTVAHGSAATAPEAPQYAQNDAAGHWKFTGWDKAFNSVTGDLTVNTVYATEAHSGGTATCKEYAKCDLCGAEYGDYADHEYGEWIQQVNKTCLEDGTLGHYTCSVCGKYFDAEHNELVSLTIAHEGHKPVKTEAKASTCTEKGNSEYYTCDDCGKIFTEEACTNEITAEQTVLDFDYTNHSTDERVTKDAKEAKCNEDGYTGDIYCAACDHEVTHGSVIPKESIAHTPVKTDSKASTCTEKGNIEYYTCEVCGRIFTEETCENEIAADDTILDFDYTNHSTDERVTKNAKEAKCNEDGYTGDIYCAACDHEVTHGSVIPKETIAHTPVKADSKAATCTEKGNIEYYTCEICGKIFTEEACENEITAEDTVLDFDYTNHSTTETVTKDAKDATCNEDGYTGDVYCAACDHLIAAGEAIPSGGTEHVFGEWYVKTAPTCTEEGVEERDCENCGESETRPIEATGHSFGEWFDDEENGPTCGKDGVQHRVCAKCGETETREVTASEKGHSIRLPNDEGEGYCAFCGEYRCLFCEKDEHMHETNDASVMTFFIHIVHIFYHMFSNFRYTLNHR